MRILAIERELPLPVHRNLHDLLREEAAVIWDMQKHGIIRDIWSTQADRRAVIMLECANSEEAQKHLATLPLVRAELIEFMVLELRTYEGLEPLFATSKDAAAPQPEEPPEY